MILYYPLVFLASNPLRHKAFVAYFFYHRGTLTDWAKSDIITITDGHEAKNCWTTSGSLHYMSAVQKRRTAYSNPDSFLYEKEKGKCAFVILLRRTMNGKKENERLWHRHPTPRGRGPGAGAAPGDTKVL